VTINAYMMQLHIQEQRAAKQQQLADQETANG
jgi:hypothetical protein